MVRKHLKEVESGSKMLDMKEELEREGFKTSWKDPFFEWLHPSHSESKETDNPFGDILYIFDPPVPKITPFDIATLEIRVDDQISLQLSIYYYKVLADAIDAEVINGIYGQHAASWAPAMAAYFTEIASEFSLRWDSEYDSFIEDSLYGFFPVASVDQIISLLVAIKTSSRSAEIRPM